MGKIDDKEDRYRNIRVNMDNILFDNSSKLFLASAPFPETLSEFIDDIHTQNVHMIVVLLPMEDILEKYDVNLLDIYRKNNFDVLHFPIEDFDIPTDIADYNKTIDHIILELQSNKNVLIHCAAGLGRTGLMAASLLITLGRNVQYSINYVRTVRHGTVETGGQEIFLYRYLEYVKLKQYTLKEALKENALP